MCRLYDIQALGQDSFYVTNFLFETRSRGFMVLELLSLMPWSTVMLYSSGGRVESVEVEGGEIQGGGYSQVVTGITSATGIVMSPCGK